MNIKVMTLISAAISLFISQCSNMPTDTNQRSNEVKSFTNISSEVLIELPNSIASNSAKLSKSSSSSNQSRDIYNGVRTYIGIANYLVNNSDVGVKAMINFWRDTLNWKYIKEIGTFSGNVGKFTWSAKYDSTIELSYQLIVKRNDIEPNPVALKIDYNGLSLQPKGRVYYDIGLFEKYNIDSLKIDVSFDKQTSGRTLNVSLGGCKMNDIEDPSNILLSLFEKDKIIHISGSSYHPGIDSIIKGVKGHCYTFTGVADPVADKSIINLGLPPSNYSNNDNALFTTYGITEMWISALIEREIPVLSDTVKSLIATSYTTNLNIEEIIAKITAGDNILVPASTINTMTVDQFKLFLKLNENISNPLLRANINTLLWIADLTQPVYFNYIGYVGNGATVPAGFAYLSGITNVLAPIIPSKTASLIINP